MSEWKHGNRPQVVIVGGGFAGIEAAKHLANAQVDVTLVDRRNYHLFQPMLYQVASAALSPADIAAPIRQVLSRIDNCRVVLAEVESIDLEKKTLTLLHSELNYDYLILAAGATHSYFGNDAWEKDAPGLKSLEDAIEIRRRILLAFESAEYEGDPEARRASLTFAVIGGGPTGVEMAGAIQEIASKSLVRNFRNIDTTSTRVLLLEGADRLLPPFDPSLSEKAKRSLESMGVEVRLNARVTSIDSKGIRIGDEFIATHTAFWAAGVQASPLAKLLNVPLDRAGRVVVNPDLSIPGHEHVFVVGDMACVKNPNDGKLVPGVAPAALQMGRYVARNIAAHCRASDNQAQRSDSSNPVKPFRYVDKGSLATIGKSKAVGQIGKLKFSGFLAWLLWGGVHVFFLIGFRNRLFVMSKWFWNWLINARDARLITGDSKIEIEKPMTFSK